jgi:NADH:ubiquinone oxidoreductase subunit 2 (subunit N)
LYTISFPLLGTRFASHNERVPSVVQPALHLGLLAITGSLLLLLQTPFSIFSESLFQLESNAYIAHTVGLTLVLTYISLIYISFYPREKLTNDFEFIPLLLTSTLAAVLILKSTDLFNFYLALELQAFSLYILTAYNKNLIFSVEAGLKYFVLGAFSSCLILYSIAQIYLSCGTLNLVNLRHAFTSRSPYNDNVQYGISNDLINLWIIL